MRDLLFKKPVFHDGLNITVRNGDAWSSLILGEKVVLRQTDGEIYNTGTVILTHRTRIDKLPDCWLKFENDPACTTKDGLKETLNQLYGEWGPTLTVIFFDVDLTPEIEDEITQLALNFDSDFLDHTLSSESPASDRDHQGNTNHSV